MRRWDLFLRVVFVLILPSAVASSACCYDLLFSTYVGGGNDDQLRDIAADSQGFVYITGGTESVDFPTTQGAYDTTHNGWYDVFVAKLSPSGDLLWSTFVGGPNYDRAYAIDVDASGYIYVAGRGGPGFPVTDSAFQTEYLGHDNGIYGQQNAFLFKMAPDGSDLVWCSYFGVTTLIRDLDVDSDGDIYITSGYWPGMSPDSLPRSWLTNAYQKSPQGAKDGVVAKVRTDGSLVEWATYLGGSGDEGIEASIRVDDSCNVYVLQFTMSTDVPTSPGAYDTSHNGNWDYYLAKLNPDGSNLLFGTYLGGSQNEFISTHNLGLNGQGDPYVLASTGSADYPVTPGAYQETYGGGGSEIAVSRVSPDGTYLVASTFIGGGSNENGEGITVDPTGGVFFSGDSWSPDFPVTPDAYQPVSNGGQEGVLVGLSPDLSGLSYSTFLGGSSDDGSRAFTMDPQGCLFHAGWTQSDDFPLVNPFQDSLAGGWDLAIAKLCPAPGIEEHRAGDDKRPRFRIRTSRGRLSVECTLPTSSTVELRLYDCAGRMLVTETRLLSGGCHSIDLAVDSLASGIFFLSLGTPASRETRKVIVVR